MSQTVPPVVSAQPPLQTPGLTPPALRRLSRVFTQRPLAALEQVEHRLYHVLSTYALHVIRIALGIIFLWFGALKFFPVTLPIDLLAERTLVALTFHQLPATLLLHLLASWECAIGIGLLTRRFLRVAIVLLFLQMPGTFLPLILFRQETWLHLPWLPTFEGQYIIKNFVLIAAGIVIASTCRGGRIIAHPEIADRAKRVEVAQEEKDLCIAERNP